MHLLFKIPLFSTPSKSRPGIEKKPVRYIYIALVKQFIRKMMKINARINLQVCDEKITQHPYIVETQILRLIDW